MILLRIAVLVGLGAGSVSGNQPLVSQFAFASLREIIERTLSDPPLQGQVAVLACMVTEEDPIAAQENILSHVRSKAANIESTLRNESLWVRVRNVFRSLRFMDAAVHEHLVGLHVQLNPQSAEAREALIDQAFADFSTDWQDARIAYLSRSHMRHWYLMAVLPAMADIRAGNSPYAQSQSHLLLRPRVRMPKNLWINYLLALMIGNGPSPLAGAAAHSIAPIRAFVSGPVPARPRQVSVNEFLDIWRVFQTMDGFEMKVLQSVLRELPSLLANENSGKPELDQAMDWFAIRMREQYDRLPNASVNAIRAGLNVFEAIEIIPGVVGFTVRACTLKWGDEPLILTAEVAERLTTVFARNRARKKIEKDAELIKRFSAVSGPACAA